MNALYDFRKKLMDSAPEEIDYIYPRRSENTTGVILYIHDKENEKWSMYEVDYELKDNPSKFWEQAESYYLRPADDFVWAMCHAAKFIEAAVDYHGWGKEYGNEFIEWCGQSENRGPFTLTPEQMVKRSAFAFHFLKDKLPSPEEKACFSMYDLWEPDPRKEKTE